MSHNIDKSEIEREANVIRTFLEGLQKDVKLSEAEKVAEAENLQNRAVALENRARELNFLEDEKDAESSKEMADTTTLSNSFREITRLCTEIINPEGAVSTTTQPEVVAQSTQIEEEKKGFFKQIGDWFSEKRQDFENKDTKEKIITVLNRVGAVAFWTGTVIALRSLFSKEARERRREKRRKRREAKEAAREERRKKKAELSFWERPVGKVIKFIGGGGVVYYIVHGLKTGKRGLKDLIDRDKALPTSSAGEVLNDYTELSHENLENYEKYESIGENINSMYDKIRDTEKNYFGADSQVVLGEIGDREKEQRIQRNENFENIGTLGLVPYSLDNFYGNVGEMLSYGGVNKYLRSKNIEEYKQKIKSFGAEWFSKTMVPFLSTFPNFVTFGILKTDSAAEKMNKYLNGISQKSEENLEILDLFFRQYTKVLTYMADKKNALAQKCAREVLVAKGYDGKLWPTDPEDQEEMVNKAVNDSEWVEENLKTTKYGNFLERNIIGACEILKEESLDGSEMTDELKEVVEGVDEQTEKIIGGFNDNAFVKAESKFNNGQSLDGDDKKGLREISQNLLKDLGGTTTGSRMYHTFDYAFELLDLEEADRQTILQESGLTKCLGDTIEAINKLTAEIQSNPTKENVEQLKNLVGEYTSMKKELAVAVYAMKEAKENKDLSDCLGTFFGSICTFYKHFFKSAKDLFKGKYAIGDFINIFAGLTISGGLLKIGGRAFNCAGLQLAGQYMKNVGLFPVTLTEMGLGHTRRGWAVKQRINRLAKTRTVAAENLMKKKILDGILSPRQVAKLVQENSSLRTALRLSGYQNNDRMFAEVVHNIFGESLREEAELFIKHYPRARGLISYSRDTVMNGGWANHKFIIDPDSIKKSFEPLKSFDKEFDKLLNNSVQKSYFEFMLKKVRGFEDMKALDDLIKDPRFLEKITQENLPKLKKIRIEQLGKLRERGLLDDFLGGKASLDEVLEKVSKLDTKMRRAFSSSIDNVIGKLREVGNTRAIQKQIDNLKLLRNDISLADDEMEGFIKFIDHGFDGKLLPDLQKLFKISNIVEEGEKLGSKIRRLMSEGNFEDVKVILRNGDYGKAFKNIHVDDLIKNFDSVISKFGKVTGKVIKPLKNFMKILAKVL